MRVADYRMLHLSRANLFTVVGGICRLGTFAYSDDRPKIVYFNIIYIMRIYRYGARAVRDNKVTYYKTRKPCRMKFQDATNAPGKFAKTSCLNQIAHACIARGNSVYFVRYR